jgi:hypothetical protein
LFVSKDSLMEIYFPPARVVDPDSETLWIRIRIGNPDPDPGARKLRNFSGKNALFSYLKKIFYH